MTVQSEPNERKWVLLLCLFAAAHVFIFAAAFPFFNNVDEQAHFDLTVKYSHGEFPRQLGLLSQESLQYIAIYSSQEFLAPEKNFPGGQMPPPIWLLPPDKIAPVLRYREAGWQNLNHESSQPPLYYLLAGAWWRLENLCGVDGGRALYGLRFLNLFFIATFVWLGHAAARLVFPENRLVRLGVPALIAFVPQTSFYGISNDVLSPLAFGAAFILLVRFSRAEIPGATLGAITGLALAATFLTKISNLPLLGVSALFVFWKIFRLARDGRFRASWPAIFSLALCAGIPMAGWLAWCRHYFGDFTGTAAKIGFLGWTHKPFAEWWHHPIFTPHGLWTFLSGIIATFWQGEFMWHGQALALGAANLIYPILSVGLIVVALTNLRPAVAPPIARQHRELWFAFSIFAAAVTFLGFLSIIYDFHDCFYPSREHPYFTSGRLMLGSLIPFLILILFGLDCALGWIKIQRARWLVLAGLILFMFISEIITDWPVFSDSYNCFHM